MNTQIKTRTGQKCHGVRAGLVFLAAGGVAVLVSGCVVRPYARVGFAPVVVDAGPVYVAPEPVMVPETYVWDGYENVGLVGGAYFYLGPGNVWLGMDSFHRDRFNGWAGHNPGWREHTTVNVSFRRDTRGDVHPRGDARGNAPHQAPGKKSQKAAPKAAPRREEAGH